MEGRAALAAALIILLSVQFYATLSSNTQTTGERLLEETSHNIPKGLPWYPIVVFGDNRPEVEVSTKFTPVFLEILNETRVINPFAMIGTGDQVGRGTPWQIDALYKLLSGSGIWNIWLAVGNHDIQYGGSVKQWSKVIAPLHYYRDDFPGWRIAVLDDETGSVEYWKSELENATIDLGNRSLILVYHRPVLPDVGHNMDPERASILISFVESHPGVVKLALQGHWHGFAVEKKYNVTWIITGGAGAPLYEDRGPKPGNDTMVITGRNHYLILILYPNGTLKYTTILVGNNRENNISYRLTRETLGNTTVITGVVKNNLVDINGKPAAIPVRINLTGRGNSFIELMANPAGTTGFKFTVNSTGYWVETNSTTWYALVSSGNRSLILDQHHPHILVKQGNTTRKTNDTNNGTLSYHSMSMTESVDTTQSTVTSPTTYTGPVSKVKSTAENGSLHNATFQAGDATSNKGKTLAEWIAAALILIAAMIYVGRAHG